MFWLFLHCCTTFVDLVDIMLSTFYQTAGELYDATIYTANIHSLEHTVSLVRLWGPLWAYSMFAFENLNGYLGKTYHGTRRIIFQMSFQIQLLQTLSPKLIELSASESPSTQEYINGLVNKQKFHMQEIEEH